MIDSHVHVVPPRLPGVGPLDPRLNDGPEAVADWLREEMSAAGVSRALAMGCWAPSDDDPLGVSTTLAVADFVPGLSAIGICDPTRTDATHYRRCGQVLADGRVKALKVYLGYLHYEPSHAHYRPYYQLAEQFKLPIVFHTGDTYSPLAKLKFAQPLGVDEVAVDHPNVRFVLAHCGNPWLIEAAAVIYKNMNVYADLSGLIVGDAWTDATEATLATLDDVRDRVLKALRYAERPNRFLFGSDWPLVPLASYRNWLASWYPAEQHEAFFAGNARMLFRL